MLLVPASPPISSSSTALLAASASDAPSGFVSIDCGFSGNSSYKDPTSTLMYSPDAQYIDTGTNHNISAGYVTQGLSPQSLNVRSFNTRTRNCYTINSLEVGLKYLVRATFMYGNYDGLNKGVIFDLHIGVNYWRTVNISNPEKLTITEVMLIAPVDYIQVCLVNTGLGTPFISSLDLRPMKNKLYPYVNSTQCLSLVSRLNAGPTDTKIIRYPDDPHDRMWKPWSNVPYWSEITSTSDIQTNDLFEVPSAVLQTAVTPVNSSQLMFYWEVDPLEKDPGYLINLHFSELVKLTGNQTREFNITLYNMLWYNKLSPSYLSAVTIYDSTPHHGSQRYNGTLTATPSSTLPPILNGIELFIALEFSGVPSDDGDVNAINAIKTAYKIKRNWNGDPCAPKTYAWDGLNCSYVVSGSPRITVVRLASSGLTGEITNAFAEIKKLQTLDLSYNNLTGPIPDVLSQLTSLTLLDLRGNQLSGSIPPSLLKKAHDGSLTMRLEENPKLCSDGTSCNLKKKSNNSKIVIPIVVAIVAVVILAAVGILIYLKKYRKQPGAAINREISLHNTSPRPSIADTPILLNHRQFTYMELVTITNNFQNEVGKGGFGIVYSGRLGDGTQVAVKLRKTSTQGVKEFFTEAQLLTRIHHKNLVSLIGYCEENCLALVLEYMSEGSLQDQLLGGVAGTLLLTWRERIRIAVESAQGLEYLHTSCNPPIIHRDVKPNNILLDTKLEAKIADFGMSKAFSSSSNTHVSTARVIGTPGYVDPEYHMTFQLTEKSDVYSFGVVLLQIVTGLPAIIQQSGPESGNKMNLIQWVGQRLARGNIESIVDARMQGEHDINSIWKAADLALKCTALSGVQRPNMNEVVIQLKECMALETARVTGRNYNNNYYPGTSSNDYTGENYHMEKNDVSQSSTQEIEQRHGRFPAVNAPAAR